MKIRRRIALALTAYQLVSSGCHRAEIDLSELMPEMGKAGDGEVIPGASGSAGFGGVEGRGGASGAGGASGHAGEGAQGGAQEGEGAQGGASGAAGDTSEMAGNGGSGELVDTTPPQVVFISPSDGERGVRSDAKIVIRFSEPMNRLQTAASAAVAGLATKVEWDGLGTELSIIPEQPLEHGRGSDPAVVEAIAYSLSLGRGATDVAGNALEEDHVTTFYTSRELSTSLRGIDALIGYAIDSNNPLDSTGFVDPCAGDSFDQSMKGFMTADLSALPAETQAVTSATLTVSQYQVTGAPFEMGSMTVDHVSFSAVKHVLGAPTKTGFGVLFADAETKTASIDVTSALRSELAERVDGAGQVQFRFGFEQAANLNGATDEVRLRPLKLAVWYLVP